MMSARQIYHLLGVVSAGAALLVLQSYHPFGVKNADARNMSEATCLQWKKKRLKATY